jgi:NMD protein affecting ribosome stability and mRNA decay
MSERAEMKCKRCGDNEDRIDGFCSNECKDKYSLEEALSKMSIRIAELEAELKIAVVACCTYNSNDDAKICIYGIDQKAFTRIDQFITHYNDAVSAGKVSVDVKTSADNNKRE